MLLFRGTVLTVVVLAACGLIYWQWLTGRRLTPPLIKSMFRDKNVVVPTVATRIPT